MAHRCVTCREEFATLTRKRLHDCTGAPVEDHDLPGALIEGLPERFLTTEEAIGFDGEGIERFFPVVSVESETGSLDVAAGYANTDAGHVLLAFDDTDRAWYVVEREDTATFEHSERDLTRYVCERNDVDPMDTFGYESNDPDYPSFGR